MKNLDNAYVTARATGLSKFTLYRLAKKKEIPHFRCGRAIRFDVVEVLGWMRQQAAQGVDEKPGSKKKN